MKLKSNEITTTYSRRKYQVTNYCWRNKKEKMYMRHLWRHHYISFVCSHGHRKFNSYWLLSTDDLLIMSQENKHTRKSSTKVDFIEFRTNIVYCKNINYRSRRIMLELIKGFDIPYISPFNISVFLITPVIYVIITVVQFLWLNDQIYNVLSCLIIK